MGGCYCGEARPSTAVQPLVIQRSPLRRAMVVSVALHAAAAALASWLVVPTRAADTELVDIEIAPPPPLPEALPPEVAKPPERDLAQPGEPAPEPESTAPSEPGEGALDAGVDAVVDAKPDAAIDARPDAAIDAAIDAAPDAMAVAGNDLDADRGDAGPGIAAADAGGDALQVAAAEAGDASQLALGDAGGSGAIALGSGAGSASGSGAGPGASAAPAATGSASGPAAGSALDDTGLDTAALAAALADATPGTSDAPAVDGAPTTAGTAANLLSYFPDGHVLTALIRFDRLRGTEWAAPTERLLRPMPDYQLLFGLRDAGVADKLETLVISTPRPRDAAATTLVARTQLSRAALRDLLGQASPVTWSVTRGGLLGRRTGRHFQGDERVFLSPFQGWFVLAQPGDLAGLTAAAKGKPDTIEATAKLPPWLAGIRKIESETGEPRGPALVITVALGGKRLDLAGNDFGLGIRSLPLPDRVSLAMELVKQGWLLRGNLRLPSDADAAELVASLQRLQQRVADSRAIQLVIGKPIAHVVANLAFARAGPRVSYATSISIADARAVLAAAAQQIDRYFGRMP